MLRYVIFSILSLALVILAFLLSPALAGLSMLLKRDVLPLGLQWFSTVDDTLDGGQKQHPDKYPSDAIGWRLWWQRVCWICRNPAQGFQAYPFGYNMRDTFERIDEQSGTPGGAPFERYRTYDYYGRSKKHDRHLFSYQRNIPLAFGGCWKLWFGWAEKKSAGRMSLKCVFLSFGWSVKS